MSKEFNFSTKNYITMKLFISLSSALLVALSLLIFFPSLNSNKSTAQAKIILDDCYVQVDLDEDPPIAHCNPAGDPESPCDRTTGPCSP